VTYMVFFFEFRKSGLTRFNFFGCSNQKLNLNKFFSKLFIIKFFIQYLDLVFQ
jgi:hypothetical protein